MVMMHSSSDSQRTLDTVALTAITALALGMLSAGYVTWQSLRPRFSADTLLDATTLERLTGVALGSLGALVIMWLLLCLALSLLARRAAARGQYHRSAALSALLPGFMARLTLAGIGGSLALAGCASDNSPPSTTPVAAAQTTHRTAAPITAEEPVPPPVTGPPRDGTELLSPGFIPHRVPLQLARLAGGTTRSPDEVVVRAGDSLWSIAARHLPQDASSVEIAAAWPRWHEANRRLIGPDPNLLEIGWVLHTPHSDSPAS